MKIQLLVFYLALATLGHARLGESEAELVSRFGQPKSRTKEQVGAQAKLWEIGTRLIFYQEDWHIHCVVVDGRCAWIDYGKRGDWSEEQIQLVLSSNSQGSKWSDTTKSGGKVVRTWRRSDGAIATWNAISGLKIITPAYERARQVIEAKAKAAASRKPKI